MRQPSDQTALSGRKLLVNLGSGPKRRSRLPAVLAEWREFRVDIDPTSAPDLLADLTDLSAINSGSADVVWGRPLYRASLSARGDKSARGGAPHPCR